MVANGLNFTLVCDAGEVNLLGEVTGLGSYDDIALNADRLQLYGEELLVHNLDQLILLDLEALRKLRSLETAGATALGYGAFLYSACPMILSIRPQGRWPR